jgi:hypothetical protein
MSSADPLARDVAAFLAADKEFARACGTEADRRWAALGGAAGEALVDRQVAVVDERGPTRDVLDALAWEITERINLLERARRAARGSQ